MLVFDVEIYYNVESFYMIYRLEIVNQTEAFNRVLMQYIEAYLEVYGHINSQALCLQFHMHRSKASAVITNYRKAHPSNIRDNMDNRYSKSYTFKRKYLEVSAVHFLESVEVVHGKPDLPSATNKKKK